MIKTFKFSLVYRTRENTDVLITLDENIYGILQQISSMHTYSSAILARCQITAMHI